MKLKRKSKKYLSKKYWDMCFEIDTHKTDTFAFYTRHSPTKLRADAPHIKDYPRYSKEPKYWRKLFKHQKRRMEVKGYLQRGDWDGTCAPLDKKPWVYYW